MHLRPEEVYLVDHGIRLWSAVMKNATEYSAELHGLFPLLTKLMLRDFDHIQPGMALLGSYSLLGGARFMQGHAASVKAWRSVTSRTSDCLH